MVSLDGHVADWAHLRSFEVSGWAENGFATWLLVCFDAF